MSTETTDSKLKRPRGVNWPSKDMFILVEIYETIHAVATGAFKKSAKIMMLRGKAFSSLNTGITISTVALIPTSIPCVTLVL